MNTALTSHGPHVLEGRSQESIDGSVARLNNSSRPRNSPDVTVDLALMAFEGAQVGPTLDRFRGLGITPDETRRLLTREPGAPITRVIVRASFAWHQ